MQNSTFKDIVDIALEWKQKGCPVMAAARSTNAPYSLSGSLHNLFFNLFIRTVKT